MTAARDEAAHMQRLQALLEIGLKAHGDAVIFADNVLRLPNTTLFSAPGLKAETAVIAFDLEGDRGVVGVCLLLRQSDAPLTFWPAMGVPSGLAQGAIRLSLGWTTTESEIHRLRRFG